MTTDRRTAVIVPVMRRPQNAAPFMRSLRATTGAVVYAVTDHDDPATTAAWNAAGARVLIGTALTFARKVNVAYAVTREPWLFVVGDDVTFHPRWLDNVHVHAGNNPHAVVGTNDLSNERVLAGEHATHLLVSRAYVDTVGASWDGPGVLAHEGYRHWYVDDEIVTAAKQRGLWRSALCSVVEHHHPLHGKGTDDEVYRLGQASARADGELFAARLAANVEHEAQW